MTFSSSRLCLKKKHFCFNIFFSFLLLMKSIQIIKPFKFFSASFYLLFLPVLCVSSTFLLSCFTLFVCYFHFFSCDLVLPNLYLVFAQFLPSFCLVFAQFLPSFTLFLPYLCLVLPYLCLVLPCFCLVFALFLPSFYLI